MGKRRDSESIVEVIPVLEPGHVAAVEAAIAAHAGKAGALLPILHDVQAALGFIPTGAAAPIARALQITRADVHGVVSFYHDFRQALAGKHVLKLCQAEACQAMGARRLYAHACARLGVSAQAASSEDGQFTLEPAYCLGNCALAPAMLVGEQLYGRVSPDRFDAITQACAATVEPAA